MTLSKYENIKNIIIIFYIAKKYLYIKEKKLYCPCFSFI
jgi:hypothetical protein